MLGKDQVIFGFSCVLKVLDPVTPGGFSFPVFYMVSKKLEGVCVYVCVGGAKGLPLEMARVIMRLRCNLFAVLHCRLSVFTVAV